MPRTSRKRTKPSSAPIQQPAPEVVLVSSPISLSHPKWLTSYTFHPQPEGNVVGVVCLSRYNLSRVEMPTDEARYLYRRLRDQGYEKLSQE